MACQTNQFFIICYFFYEIRWIGRLNEVCGIIYETIRYEHCVPSNPVYLASVVLVQPVVVVVVILFRLQYVVIVYCCM
jgi:hypothetical protein